MCHGYSRIKTSPNSEAWLMVVPAVVVAGGSEQGSDVDMMSDGSRPMIIMFGGSKSQQNRAHTPTHAVPMIHT